MWFVRASSRLSNLIYDAIHACGHGVIEQWECNLARSEILQSGQVKDVEYELRHGIATDPQEHLLTIFNEIESMTLELLDSEIQSGWEDESTFAQHPSL